MSDVPFKVICLSAPTRVLMASEGIDKFFNLANQLRKDLEENPNPNSKIALAWTLTEMVQSGVHVDNLWDDIQEAQHALEIAVSLAPELAEDSVFLGQTKKTGKVLARVARFKKGRQTKLGAARRTDDDDLDAKQAADIAYASKDPEEVAHFFLLAAKKIGNTNPREAAWYLNSRVSALLDLERWDDAFPQLQKMVASKDTNDFWVEMGYIGLLRIAAGKSNVREFEKIWKTARAAHPNMPSNSPQYYEVLGFALKNEMPHVVGPVLKSLKENNVYKKTPENERLIDMASNHVFPEADQSTVGKLGSFFKRFF